MKIEKAWYNVTFTVVSAILIIVILTWLSNKSLSQLNGFSRKFTNLSVRYSKSLIKTPAIWKISGRAGDSYYFQGKRPNELYRIDDEMKLLDTIHIPITPSEILYSNFELSIDSPWVWLFAKNEPSIFRINMINKEITKVNFPNAIFTRVVKTPANTFIIRGHDKSLKTPDQVFLKGNPFLKTLEVENGISELKNDGGISTDGLLSYDNNTGLLAYVHFYQNRFLCLDTNLNLFYIASTIDTFSRLQVKTGKSKSNGKNTFTNTSPSKIINLSSCISNGLLFNYSTIKSDNQNSTEFRNNAIIDIYNVKDGRYVSSFYIPDFKGERLRDFKVWGNIVLALYKNFIVKYELNPSQVI